MVLTCVLVQVGRGQMIYMDNTSVRPDSEDAGIR